MLTALLVDDITVFIVYGINQNGMSANSTLILNVSNPSLVSAENSYIHPRANSTASFPTPTTTNKIDETTYSRNPGDDDQANGLVDSDVGNGAAKGVSQSTVNKTIGIAVGCTAGVSDSIYDYIIRHKIKNLN